VLTDRQVDRVILRFPSKLCLRVYKKTRFWTMRLVVFQFCHSYDTYLTIP